jgi:hypothetical protein
MPALLTRPNNDSPPSAAFTCAAAAATEAASVTSRMMGVILPCVEAEALRSGSPAASERTPAKTS